LAVLAPFSLAPEPAWEAAEPAEPCVSVTVAAGELPVAGALVEAVSLAVLAPFSEAPVWAVGVEAWFEAALATDPLVWGWLSLVVPALPWPPSSLVSSEAVRPGENLMISLAALRLLIAAGSTPGRVLGTAGAGTGFFGTLKMTVSGALALWKAGVQVMLP
jgi:hypothetical protein